MIKVDGIVATISIKIFPIGVHVMYLYFPDAPRIIYAMKVMEGIFYVPVFNLYPFYVFSL
jgi:hypothetical protein